MLKSNFWCSICFHAAHSLFNWGSSVRVAETKQNEKDRIHKCCKMISAPLDRISHHPLRSSQTRRTNRFEIQTCVSLFLVYTYTVTIGICLSVDTFRDRATFERM